MKNQFYLEQIKQLLAGVDGEVGFVLKVNGEKQLSFQASQSFPAASLIKLAIINKLLDSDLNLDQSVHVSESSIVGGAGVLQLLSGKDWSLRDLLSLMISVSDNSASNMIIDEIGMDKFNPYLRIHGFSDTSLNRHLMDIEALQEGQENLITADDALRLLKMALDHGEPATSWFKDQQFRYKLAGNFDEAGTRIDSYNKTGEGNQIDHDVARFVYGNNRIDVALLTLGIGQRMDAIHLFNQVGQLIADWLLEMST